MTYLHIQVLLISYVSAINGLNDGMRASFGEFKFIVSIWQRNKPLCTGAIIHERHVLTAAHCGYQQSPSSLFVYAGLIGFDDPNMIGRNVRYIHEYHGTEAIRRQGPEPLYFKDDIMILEIENEFSWSSTIGPIPIPELEHWDPCEPCLVPGWKIGMMDRIYTITLLSIYAHVFSDRRCHNAIKTLFPNEKCTHDDSGKTIAMKGDSGTPFICRGVVSGIIVRGYLQPDKPTIVLSVYPYRDFIYQTIRDDIEDVHPGEFPYVVSIWSNNVFISGGTIIDDLHIITMANSVKNLNKSILRILAGTHVISESHSTKDWLSIDHIDLYVHYEKQYSRYARNPIAVMKLTRRLVWSPVVMGAASLTGTDPLPGQRCQVLRWDRQNKWWGSITRKLVWAPAMILTKQKCQESGIPLKSNEFCATSIHPFPLAFEKDSGNPIVCNGIVAGILSDVPRKFSLFASSKAVFIRLSPYVDPIKFAMRNNLFN